MSREAIAGYIKTLRGDRKQVEVAAVAKVDNTAISRLENLDPAKKGIEQPSADLLVPVIEALGGSLLHLSEITSDSAGYADGVRIATEWLEVTKDFTMEQRRKIDVLIRGTNDAEFWQMLEEAAPSRSHRQRLLDFWKGIRSPGE